MSLRLFSLPLAAIGLLVFAAAPAAAIEPDVVAKALGAVFTKNSNVSATYDSARSEGDNVVIDGLTITQLSSDQTLKLGEVVVTSPRDSAVGVFESPRIDVAGGTLEGENRGTFGPASVTDAVVLDVEKMSADVFGEGVLFHTAEVSDIKVSRRDDPGEVTIDRITMEAGNVVDNLPQDSKGEVRNISLSPDIFPGATFTPAAIGYDRLALDLSWDSSRDVAAKTMTIRDFTLQIHDGGTLSIEGVMGNLPDPRVLDDVGGTSKASKTEVHQLTVRYLDNSLAGRVLDALAARQGLTREQYTQQLSAALPFLLLALNNPTFQGQLTTALTGFLKSPQSLTIRLDPDTPVSGSEILSMLRSSPGSVPDRLKASVTANTPE